MHSIKQVYKLQLLSWIYLLVSAAALLQLVHSQDCESITIDILGSTDVAMPTGIISEILTPNFESLDIPYVRVFEMNIVCEAQANSQDRYRFTSVIATFNCTSTDPRITECLNDSVINTRQFDLECLNGIWLSGPELTVDPIATLFTPLDSQCAICGDPRNELLTAISVDTHCQNCAGCTEGLGRCTAPNNTLDQCCNFFNQGLCVRDCPTPLHPNSNFDCVLVDCGNLTGPDNGTVMFTTTTYLSMATYTCDNGFRLEGEPSRTCLQTGEWSGSNPTCIVAEAQTPCGSSCIFGIVLTLLALLFIAGVVLIGSILVYVKLHKGSTSKWSDPDDLMENVAYGGVRANRPRERYVQTEPFYDTPDDNATTIPHTSASSKPQNTTNSDPDYAVLEDGSNTITTGTPHPPVHDEAKDGSSTITASTAHLSKEPAYDEASEHVQSAGGEPDYALIEEDNQRASVNVSCFTIETNEASHTPGSKEPEYADLEDNNRCMSTDRCLSGNPVYDEANEPDTSHVTQV